MYTPEEKEQIKHMIQNFIQMSKEAREKWVIFGDGMLVGASISKEA